MKNLKDRIIENSSVLSETVIKVDSFLNHQIDTDLMFQIGAEFANIFKDRKITKILTLEASGIPYAAITGYHMGIPCLFAKKHDALNMDNDIYSSRVFSFTKNKEYVIRISKKFIDKNDNVLIIDDFLANGQATLGMIDLIKQAGANVGGIGIIIEKGFQPGRKLLEDKGYSVNSLVEIESLDKNFIKFK